MDKLDQKEVNKLIAEALETWDEEHRSIMQANFSAALYLVSEQQALTGRLIQTLLETNVIGVQQLTKITDIESGDEGLVPTYNQIYSRFANYFLRTKHLLEQGYFTGSQKEEKEDE